MLFIKLISNAFQFIVTLRIDTSGGGVICSARFIEVWIGYYPSTYHILYIVLDSKLLTLSILI